MSRAAKLLVLFVIAFHVAVFVLEAFLWMRPGIYQVALGRLGADLPLAPHDQALVLRALFVNQGFYNLFLASTGSAGLVYLRRGNAPVGNALIACMCLTAFGAGCVLALSTRAYLGAFLQAVPSALALYSLRGRAAR